ncbi:MAG: hypothetical protein H7232_11960, partial [Aeromicrobium sp.]|nr:hypothetical protein [Burkholderiales bacterium]
NALGVARFTVTGEGGAAAIAAALAQASDAVTDGPRCERVRLRNPLALNESERAQFLSQLPDLTPHSTGAHMIAAWNWARLKALFWPWQPQNVAAARKVDAPAPVRLHVEVVEILRAGTLFVPLWRAVLSSSCYSYLAQFGGRIHIQCDDEPERIRITSQLAASIGIVGTIAGAEQQSSIGVRTWQK